MNGQTLELESSHRLTVAPSGGDDPKTVTITVQDGQRVALAHLTPDEVLDAAERMIELAYHVSGDQRPVVVPFKVDMTPQMQATIDDAAAALGALTEELGKRDAKIVLLGQIFDEEHAIRLSLQGELDALHIAAASKVSAPIDALEDPKVEILEGKTPDEVA